MGNGDAFDVFVIHQGGEVFTIPARCMRHDDDKTVFNEVVPRCRVDIFSGFVHGDTVGGGEHIHWRTFCDLLQQGTAAGVVQIDFRIRILGLVGLGDVIEGIGQAGSGGDSNFSGDGTVCERSSKGGEEDYFHDGIPVVWGGLFANHDVGRFDDSACHAAGLEAKTFGARTGDDGDDILPTADVEGNFVVDSAAFYPADGAANDVARRDLPADIACCQHHVAGFDEGVSGIASGELQAFDAGAGDDGGEGVCQG